MLTSNCALLAQPRTRASGATQSSQPYAPQRSSPALVACLSLGRLFDVIDHQHLRRRFLRLQFQAKLLLHGVNERRLTRVRASFAISPMQVEIVVTLQACLIDDGSPQLPRELLHKIVERSTLCSDSVHLVAPDVHA